MRPQALDSTLKSCTLESCMKNVTLSADENLIEQARLVAQARRTTLNAAFREWLEQYAAQAGGGAAIESLMQRLRHIKSSGLYTRDEMNEP